MGDVRKLVFGSKAAESIAFGMTETCDALRLARNIVFSLLEDEISHLKNRILTEQFSHQICETQII